jgi:hypothetical protein
MLCTGGAGAATGAVLGVVGAPEAALPTEDAAASSMATLPSAGGSTGAGGGNIHCHESKMIALSAKAKMTRRSCSVFTGASGGGVSGSPRPVGPVERWTGGNRVEAAGEERVAAGDASAGQPHTLSDPVNLQCFHRIVAAGWMKTAHRWGVPGNELLVTANGPDERV